MSQQKKIKMCQLYIQQKLKAEREADSKGVKVTLKKYNLQNPMDNDYRFEVKKEEILQMMSEEEREKIKDCEDLVIQIAEFVMKQGINGFQQIENTIVSDIKEAHKKYGLAS